MKNKLLFCYILNSSIVFTYIIYHIYPLIEWKIFELLAEKEIEESCVVPKLIPFNESILQFIGKRNNITCSINGPLVDSNLSYLYVNKHLLPAYGVYDIRNFSCCYQVFERAIQEEFQSDDGIVYLNKCKPFSSKTQIEHEFVEVFCVYQKKRIYHDMHSFVPIKKNRNKFANTKQKLNVLIYGIDSMSHMNFQRQMPKTQKYIDENLNSIPIFGYNKIDDNTSPNLLAILTGHSKDELRQTCFKYQNRKYDKCHFIWNDYSDAGYLTAYAEDATTMGIFNIYERGFQIQPTNYYWRTFCHEAEKLLANDYCLGPRPTHKVLLDYAKKFTLSLKDEPYFGLFWSVTLSHNCLNCPSLSDDDHEEFFEGLKRDNVLNKTVVIFLSDHGIRGGQISETYQGYLEERLPLLYFIFPPWFDKSYPNLIKNIRNNSNRLTSNFDLHKTLLDLLDVDKLKTKYSIQNKEVSKTERGISLFSIIPKNRTCEMAGIASHWCSCKRRYKISTNDLVVNRIARFIVSYLNKLMKLYKTCATLVLDSVKNAKVTKSEWRNNIVSKEYTVTLRTKPSNALFESTVLCIGDCYKKKSYKISGTVSRLNKYGNQSSCISHYLLRMYCYCI